MNSTFNSKNPIKYFICITITALALLMTATPVFSYSNANMDITFQMPDEDNLNELPAYSESENMSGYSDINFNSVIVVASDIYYTLEEQFPDLEQQQISERYPKDTLWLGCGLFDETWNDMQYMTNYLTESVNSSTAKYYCSMEMIDIKGLPVYKFTYLAEQDNFESSGGTIYFTLYKSKTYLVEISNYFNYSDSASYIEIFEETLSFNGIENFEFVNYNGLHNDLLHSPILLTVVGVAALALIIAATVYFVRKQKGKK